MDVVGEKKESLWQELLENILTEKKEPQGNVMIFGNPNCGKKRFIELMDDLVSTQHQEKKGFEDLERVYIMDFKYLQLKNQGDMEDTGKLNFFIMNKKYDYIKQFFSTEMFKNLVVIICIDLEKPGEILRCFMDWYEYIQKAFKEFLLELDVQSRQKILKDFKATFDLLAKLKGKIEEEGTPDKSPKEDGTNAEIQEEEEEGDDEE